THRKFILPSFHGARMRGYGEMMVEVAREEIARWPIGEPLALWPRMQSISNEVVMRAVFGRTEGEHMERLRVLLRHLTDWLNDSTRLTWVSVFGSGWLARNAQFREAMASVEAALMEEVRRRRAAPRRAEDEGILSLLEEAYDENGTPMTDQELRDELITLLSDGPTATSLAWAFERLLRHPDKLARLREEALAGEEDAYADAVVKEILRLCPAVPLVMRKLVQPMELGDYTIAAGTTVAPCIYLVHHREDIYPHPYSFMPERFLDRTPDTYTWIPFGSGVRRCVAASFAQLEMRLVMHTVLQEVELSAVGSDSERPARSSVAFAPGDQARVVVTRRRPWTRAVGGGVSDAPSPRPIPSPAA